MGKEPIPDLNLPLNGTKSSGGQLFLDSERCALPRSLALFIRADVRAPREKAPGRLPADHGERPYREYPSEWVLRTLERASFIGSLARHDRTRTTAHAHMAAF